MNAAVDGELHIAVVGNLLRPLAGNSTLLHRLQPALCIVGNGLSADGLIHVATPDFSLFPAFHLSHSLHNGLPLCRRS